MDDSEKLYREWLASFGQPPSDPEDEQRRYFAWEVHHSTALRLLAQIDAQGVSVLLCRVELTVAEVGALLLILQRVAREDLAADLAMQRAAAELVDAIVPQWIEELSRKNRTSSNPDQTDGPDEQV